MNRTVLFVDDETNILTSFKRQLRRDYDLYLAEGEEALNLLDKHKEIAVVVSDLRMPGMDGIELLRRVKEKHPQVIRIMLTGNADIESAIEAINEGAIFRFLTKPTPRLTLMRVVDEGLKYYHLQQAERELLEQTLLGAIKVLSEMGGIIVPRQFGRAARIKQLMSMLGVAMQARDLWQLEAAAMLALIGTVTLPAELLERHLALTPLNPEEKAQYYSHVHTAHVMIKAIPRLDEVANIILYQEKNMDGSGYPQDSVKGDEIPLGARMLRVLLEYDRLCEAGRDSQRALKELEAAPECFDVKVLIALSSVAGVASGFEQRTVSIFELREEGLLGEDLVMENGTLLVSKGAPITSMLVKKLQFLAKKGKIANKILVYLP